MQPICPTEENREKCTRQCAPIATKSARYHSNPTQVDQSTVGIVGPREEAQEEEEDIRFDDVQDSKGV